MTRWASLPRSAGKDPAFLERAEKINKVVAIKGPEAFWQFQPEELKRYQPLAISSAFASRADHDRANSPARRLGRHRALLRARVSDGLPVVPPTELVAQMLTGTRRRPDDVVGQVPPRFAEATVESVAVHAVMAGCRPAYLPVVLAALEAMLEPAFRLHGVIATTHVSTRW